MGAVVKVCISPEKERMDCWRMAAEICRHEPVFDLVVGITRGGGPISFYLQEFFASYWRKSVKYATLRTRSYDDIASAGHVEVGNLEEVLRELDGKPGRILLADDIFDRGKTIDAVLQAFREGLPQGTEVKVATLYYKPDNNEVDFEPDYYVRKYSGNEWIVFPHSVSDLDNDRQMLAEFGMPDDLQQMLVAGAGQLK